MENAILFGLTVTLLLTFYIWQDLNTFKQKHKEQIENLKQQIAKTK